MQYYVSFNVVRALNGLYYYVMCARSTKRVSICTQHRLACSAREADIAVV